MIGKMKEYVVSDRDIAAINRLIETGGEMASITRDSINFEVGILAESGLLPVAYGSGNSIADAIDEALNAPSKKVDSVSSNQVERAMDWLRQKGVKLVTR